MQQADDLALQLGVGLSSLVDASVPHVCPENHACLEYEVQSRGAAGFVHNCSHLTG